MLDFAKSIMVGNATDRNGKELKVGDMVAVKTSDPTLNHGRIVRISGDQISVDVTGEDDIWTTPARKAVKMGNSIVGNADADELERLKELLKSLKKEGGERGFGMTPIMYRDTKEKIKELEKKIKSGNSKVENAEVIKDGDVWVVLYAEGTKSKEFNSEAEAKRFAAQVGNSRSI